MTVTKERIIAAVFNQGLLPRKDARTAVEKLMAIVKKTLADGEDVLVSGFGKFQVKRKRARRGRNPQTSEAMELRPRRVVTFHISGILRRKLNGEEADAAAADGFDSGDEIRIKAGRKTDKERP